MGLFPNPEDALSLLEDTFSVENDMLRHSNGELLSEETERLQRIAQLEESLLEISDRFDNLNWSPLGDAAGNETELKLETVKKIAEMGRAMNMSNPFVKRGVQARISYIWGKGVAFDGVEAAAKEMGLNRKRMFSAQAFEEIERALATDGNVFTALSKDPKKVRAFRIPLEQIGGAVMHKTDNETIIYYKRVWEEITTDGRNGQTKSVTRIEYIPSLDYHYELEDTDTKLKKTWRGESINQDYVIHHMTVNKQVGWKWGLPDVFPVILWAKAYKEYLEDNALLVKAYSRLAWQYKSANKQGGNAAASAVRRMPTRDPISGELRDVGGSAVTGGGHDIVALPATGSTVDFDKGSALAAAIASGLEVSKVVITSDPGAGNRSAAETLDGPTRKAMETRQQLHVDRFLEIYEYWGLKVTELGESRVSTTTVTEAEEAARKNSGSGRDYVTVSFPPIDSDSTKDRIAALGTMMELYILHPEEVRKEALDVFGIPPFKPWDDLPEKPEIPDPGVSGAQGNTQPSVIAKQGVSGGVSAAGKAQGTANSARDNRSKDEGK